MNEYLEKTIEITKKDFYLDNLLEIYPPEEIERGLKVENFSPSLKKIFKRKENEKLLEELINLKKKGFKFPIENPYISMLFYSPELIRKNPKTVKKICKKLYEFSYEELKRNLEIPKKASRRIGPMFQNWLRGKYKFVDEFEKNSKEITFLKGSDKKLKNFASKSLGCQFKELTKGIDFLAKVTSKYYLIGTAKFITDFGGSQTNQFYEAIHFLREVETPKNVVKIALIDGIIWFIKGGRLKKQIEDFKSDEFIFSALLLDEFLKKEFNK